MARMLALMSDRPLQRSAFTLLPTLFPPRPRDTSRGTPGSSGTGTPSSVKAQPEDLDLLNMVKQGLHGWKDDEDEAAARKAGGRTLAERAMLITSALQYRPYEVGAQKRRLINTYSDVTGGRASPRLR